VEQAKRRPSIASPLSRPRERAGGADLHYRRKGDRYLLYSVGANGKDDGGKGYEDQTVDEPCDDLVVRMRGAGK